MKNGYYYSRLIFDWSFENPTKTNPTLIALYLFIVEINNRLGWKVEFGITAKECMEATGINSYNTYKKNFNILIENNFITIIKQSINQYQCNIIALSKNDKAHNKALDKALARHVIKQSESTEQSTCDIQKQINQETNKPRNKEPKISLFKNSIDFDFNIFKEKLIKDFSELEIKNCYDEMTDWSNSSLKMKADWIATARNWIRRKTPIKNRVDFNDPIDSGCSFPIIPK